MAAAKLARSGRTGWAQESTSPSVRIQHAHFSIAFEILRNRTRRASVRQDASLHSPVTRGKAECGDPCPLGPAVVGDKGQPYEAMAALT